ncbi:MAG: protein kinase [Verrucomicrobia bacterium]|nr:protein kinase [Verrucomicrobiota bacterium]
MNSDELMGRIEHSLGRAPSSIRPKSSERPPPIIPNYQLLACIGSGSYGDVWLARGVTGALHAIKVVWRSRFDSDRPYEREFRGIVKFEPISRSHPGVINILHVGRDDAAGYFYYAMELADAVAVADGHASGEATETKVLEYVPRTLASDLKAQTRLPVMEAVALGVQLAGAVGHLHRNGLVHRDIKPSNVIFVRGQAKLADIGLVTGVQEDRSFVGTEGYIPPEGPGGERADLYALGRLLYESSTGLHRSDFPSLPADLDRWPKMEREQLIDLSEVLARACAPQPKDRHANAAELAGDLNLILAGRSVRKAYRIERHLRHARIVSIAALAVVLLAIASNYFQRQRREQADAHARRESALRVESQQALARAEVAERDARQSLFNALGEQARATVLTSEMGHRVRALEAIRNAVGISNSVSLRGIALTAFSLPDLAFERELPIAPNQSAVRCDPQFNRIALGRGAGPVEIRSLTDGSLQSTLPASTNRPATSVIWSADGRHCSVDRDCDPAGRTKDIELWDVAASRRLMILSRVPWGAAAFFPGKPWILAARQPSGAVLWNLESGAEERHYEFEGQPLVLAVAPDGKSFAMSQTVTGNCLVSIRSIEDNSVQVEHLFTRHITALTWHPDGRWLAIPDHGGGVQLMNPQSGEVIVLGYHKANAVTAEFTPGGRYLFTGGWDRQLNCWDTKALRRAFFVNLDSYRCQFSADGRQCALLRWPETQLRLFRFDLPALHREFEGDLGGYLNYADFSPDGRWLAASGAGQQTFVWSLRDRSVSPARLKSPPETRVAFSLDGELFLGHRSRWSISAGNNKPVLARLTMPHAEGLFSLSLLSNTMVLTGTKGTKVLSAPQPSDFTDEWRPTISGWNGVSARRPLAGVSSAQSNPPLHP